MKYIKIECRPTPIIREDRKNVPIRLKCLARLNVTHSSLRRENSILKLVATVFGWSCALINILMSDKSTPMYDLYIMNFESQIKAIFKISYLPSVRCPRHKTNSCRTILVGCSGSLIFISRYFKVLLLLRAANSSALIYN